MVPGTRQGQRAARRQEGGGHRAREPAPGLQESTRHVNREPAPSAPGTAPGGAAARARTAQSSSARHNARAAPPPAPRRDASRAPPPTRRPSSLTACRRQPLGRAGGGEAQPAGKNRALRPRPNLHHRVGNGRRACAVPPASLRRGLRPFLSPGAALARPARSVTCGCPGSAERGGKRPRPPCEGSLWSHRAPA